MRFVVLQSILWQLQRSVHPTRARVLAQSSSTRRSVAAGARPSSDRRRWSTVSEQYGRSSPATATQRLSSATRPTSWSFYWHSNTPPSTNLDSVSSTAVLQMLNGVELIQSYHVICPVSK